MKITHVLSIKASIETVFAFLEEEDEAVKWNPKLESVKNPLGFDPRHPVGTPFIQGERHDKGVEHSIGEVTAYKKPHRISLRMRSYDYTVDVTYRLSRLGKGTKLHFESNLTSTNWIHRLFLPVTQSINKRSIIRNLRQLQIAAEKN